MDSFMSMEQAPVRLLFGCAGFSRNGTFSNRLPELRVWLPWHQIQQSALKHLIETLFEGSADKVVAALLGKGSSEITEKQSDMWRS